MAWWNKKLPSTPQGGYVPRGETSKPATTPQEATIPQTAVPSGSSPTRYGSGGGGGSSTASINRGVNVEAQRQAEIQRQAELVRQKAIVDQFKVEQQQKVISLAKQKLQSSGRSQTITRDLTSRGTGEAIRTTNLINQITGERVFTRTNLDTGETRTKVFERKKGRGGATQTGGTLTTTPVNQETPTTQPIKSPTKKSPTKLSQIFQGSREFLFGETGKKFVGIGTKSPIGLQTGLPAITFQDLQTKLRGTNLGGKVVAEFIPTTPGAIAITGGSIALIPALPTIARVAIGGGIALLELPKAFDPTLPPEQRITSGIVGGLAGAGTTFEALPFIKGGFARFSPKFKSIKIQSEGFKAIGSGKNRIGLILEKAPAKTGVTKGIDLPKTSQLVRGGFGVKGSEKGLFLGGGQKVATSQIGLFKPGKEIKLTREFFVTPQEPTLKIPTTRISRLGLSDLFKFNKQSQISFGLPGSPQIAVESGAKITRAGKGTSFKIGTGSELEAIKSSTILTNIKKVGVTSIRGQKVDLFTFKSAPGGKISSSISMTTQPLTRVSGEVTLATALKSNGVKLVSATTTQPITTATFSTTIPTLPKIFSTLTRQPSRRSPPRSPPISRIITPPTTTILKSFKSPPITTPFQPTITRTRRSPPIIPRTPTFAPPTFKGGRFPKQRIKKYPTLVRRFGKWKTIALSKTPQKAIFKGQRYSKQTLGRSFYVPGSKTLVLPGFRTKKEKGIGKIYIQKTGKGRTSTLGSFGERREIKLFQGLSPKKKTRKRRKKK